MFSLIQTHHSLGKATRRSKQSSQRNHRWCWNRQTVGRNHQVSLVIPLTHVETQGWTPIVSFHNIQTFHRFKFDVCYPNLIPKTWNCYTRKWLYILLGINWCFWSGQEASHGAIFSPSLWGSTLLEYPSIKSSESAKKGVRLTTQLLMPFLLFVCRVSSLEFVWAIPFEKINRFKCRLN